MWRVYRVAEVIESGKAYSLFSIPSEAEFDTSEEASAYCKLINPDYLWVIEPDETENHEEVTE